MSRTLSDKTLVMEQKLCFSVKNFLDMVGSRNWPCQTKYRNIGIYQNIYDLKSLYIAKNDNICEKYIVITNEFMYGHKLVHFFNKLKFFPSQKLSRKI